MTRYRWRLYYSFLLLFLTSAFLSYSQGSLSIKEIVEKNIEAAGGKKKLAEIKNYSFKAGTTVFYLSSDGCMKIVEGREPVVTEVITIDQDKVKRNCFNNITEFSGLQKLTYQSLAKLRSGLFTLEKFKDQLELEGMKKFGPKEHLMLKTTEGDLDMEFYLDPEEFTLKRLVLKGFDPSFGKYEVNHDLGPYQDISGVKIPSSWFGSQVGTRGRNYEISDVKINIPLNKDFFSKLEINVGEVSVSQGSLKGNVIDFNIRGKNLFINTNWTAKCIQGAGFKTKDKLILKVKDIEIELDFFTTSSELPPRTAFPEGAKVMFLDSRRGETYLIYLYEVDFTQLAEILEPLLPIHVNRK